MTEVKRITSFELNLLRAQVYDGADVPRATALQLFELLDRLFDEVGPVPEPGDVYRVGTQCPRNLYLHPQGRGEGIPIGQLRTPELAAYAEAAMNAKSAADRRARLTPFTEEDDG